MVRGTAALVNKPGAPLRGAGLIPILSKQSIGCIELIPAGASTYTVASIAGDQHQLLTDADVAAKLNCYAGHLLGVDSAAAMADRLQAS